MAEGELWVRQQCECLEELSQELDRQGLGLTPTRGQMAGGWAVGEVRGSWAVRKGPGASAYESGGPKRLVGPAPASEALSPALSFPPLQMCGGRASSATLLSPGATVGEPHRILGQALEALLVDGAAAVGDEPAPGHSCMGAGPERAGRQVQMLHLLLQRLRHSWRGRWQFCALLQGT